MQAQNMSQHYLMPKLNNSNEQNIITYQPI